MATNLQRVPVPVMSGTTSEMEVDREGRVWWRGQRLRPEVREYRTKRGVHRIRARVVKVPKGNLKGYHQCRIPTLMIRAFHPEKIMWRIKGIQHLDGDKSNCALSNLRWEWGKEKLSK